MCLGGGEGGVTEGVCVYRQCVCVCALGGGVCVGGVKPCPSDAGGFTTAFVMSWQRAEGGDGGGLGEGWRGTMAHEGKVSQYYVFSR